MASFKYAVLLRKRLVFDKSGRPRDQNQNAFILCESIFTEKIGSNWLMASFGCAIRLRKRLVFDKSGHPRRQNQNAFILCESIFAEKNQKMFKLAHCIFWVRCTFEKAAGFWQKWTFKRPKSKCFHSMWDWFQLAHGVFWVRCTFEKTAGFWQKWSPERPKSNFFHSMWINLRRRSLLKFVYNVFSVRRTFNNRVSFPQKSMSNRSIFC